MLTVRTALSFTFAIALSAGTAAAQTAASVTVQNNRAVPATVVLVANGVETPLATLAPSTMASIALPNAVQHDRAVQVRVHPLDDSGDYATDMIDPARAGSSRLVVPADVPDSTVNVFEVSNDGSRETTTLTVQNMQTTDARILAADGMHEEAIGTAPPMSIVTFIVPTRLIARHPNLRFFVEPQHGVETSTESLHLEAGEHLALRVAP